MNPDQRIKNSRNDLCLSEQEVAVKTGLTVQQP
jgi:hypothetical protein